MSFKSLKQKCSTVVKKLICSRNKLIGESNFGHVCLGMYAHCGAVCLISGKLNHQLAHSVHYSFGIPTVCVCAHCVCVHT